MLLDRILVADPPPFALLRREGGAVEVLLGEVVTLAELGEIPLSDKEVLAIVPYRQITERGFEFVEDQAPLLALLVSERDTVPVDQVLDRVADLPFELVDAGFDLSDQAYAEVVRKVLAEEIGHGAGANFVIKREYTARIPGYTPATALAVFRRLLLGERGAYWTFLVNTGERTFVGATPERHVSLDEGTVVMNPISGTYRHPDGRPDRDRLLDFLGDGKETDELYMVVDEELKMMADVCDLGGRVLGPYLKQMSRLTHTEYLLSGQTSLDAREVLRRTMFAATVTGSPLESACRVIARYEQRGRGYYSGVIALIGPHGSTVDAPILIRTAEIARDGSLRVGVGATLVRNSVPDNEVAETHAKAAGVLAALHGRSGSGPAVQSFAEDEQVRQALAARNGTLARFWLDSHQSLPTPLAGRRALVVDAEDTFTAMLRHMLRTLGLAVTTVRYDADPDLDGYDLVVAGPGPGDPREVTDPKMAAMRAIVDRTLHSGQPLLAVCLGHQVLCSLLGFELVRKELPYQGVQREVDLFGAQHRVGFYSTFVALAGADAFGDVAVSRDAVSGEVHALRGPRFASTQFHPESVLTEHGIDLLTKLVLGILP
ncbi:phenazine biosynthesis protein PhzE [Kutzneria viridogrisea]|uniref:anthranilate synthase n=2 Tax=Kutzneria TaxID=43356 RepID=W5W3K6_9PSEU|nr:anthranilate synthase family protein [Kutzneria albida]AHH95422.1 Anthranilate synthase, phenazine specific [Kutzneria albida DSM 43870]MBA8927219.1 phenazine biosynthesis protein phzE [Kutzneria viridogrisea]